MFGLFGKSKSLSEHLGQVNTVKIRGVLFQIRKVDPLLYMDGSNIILKSYDVYQAKDAALSTDANARKAAADKMRAHMADVILASVVRPKLSRKPQSDGSTHIDELFNDLDMALELYQNIMDLTYGKKKLKIFR